MKTLFLLGAGISTAAGIPDYTNVEVRLDIQDLLRLRVKRVCKWAVQHQSILNAVGNAKPTEAHKAVHSYVRQQRHRGIPAMVITQNVDGLDAELFVEKDQHDEKIPMIAQAHGSLLRTQTGFFGCQTVRRNQLRAFGDSLVPAYLQTYGFGYPDVVLLGMSVRLPGQIEQLASIFDECLCVGTTLTIQWTNQLVAAFNQAQKPVYLFSRTIDDIRYPTDKLEWVEGDIQSTIPDWLGVK
jgi:NAD-dependent SIR2 family protein deacetylase